MSKRYYEWDKVFDLNKKECAFLIIDMQKGFVDEGPLMVPMAKEQVPDIKKLASFCHDNDIPVLYSKFDFEKDFTYDFYWKMAPQRNLINEDGSNMFTKTADETQIVPALEVIDKDIVFDKFGYDCFGHTDLDNKLKELGVKTLIIAGTVVNWCVDSTIRSAYHKDYNVVVMADGVSGYNHAGISGLMWRDIELDLFAEAFAQVMDSDEIISELNK